jgi:uncharacterized protein YkwD
MHCDRVTVTVMQRRFRLIGVLVAVVATVGGAYVAVAVDDVDGAASVGAPAQRIAVPSGSRLASPAGAEGLASTVVELVNHERAERGLAPYVAQPQVVAAAQVHSDDMAGRATISHTGADGSNTGDRLVAQGFTWSAWGENVAAGQDSAEAVFGAWMNSAGHRPQMIGNYSYIGVGVTASANGTLYWTLVVAS